MKTNKQLHSDIKGIKAAYQEKPKVYGSGKKAYVIETVIIDGKEYEMKKYINTYGKADTQQCHMSGSAGLKNKRVSVYGKGGSFPK